MLASGDRVAERYVVESLAGRGGMAVVYRVQHAQLGSTHALKLLAMRGKALSRRLEQEGRIQARLRHPNILQVTDLVEHDGQIGLVMEWIETPALDEWLATNGPLPLDAALSLFAGVLSAVIAAHDLGILHRDLKPANIMLARGLGGYVPKVADFGIAKMVLDESPSLTVGGMPMGSPGYMAPEQIRSAKDVDVRADVFSLGGVLYCMLAGSPPFDGDEPMDLMEATLAGNFRSLADAVPGTPAHVVAAVAKALAPEPADRFVDVRALGRAVLADRPELLPAVELADDAGLRVDRSMTGQLSIGSMALRGPPSAVGSPTLVPTLGGGTLSDPSSTVMGERTKNGLLGAIALIGVGFLLLGGVVIGLWLGMRPPVEPPVAAVDAPIAAPAPTVVPAPVVAQVAVAAPVAAPVVAAPAPSAVVAPPKPAPVIAAPDPLVEPAAVVDAPVPVVEAPVPVVAPAPEPAPAVVVAPAPAPSPAAPAPPDVEGTWRGKANGQPLTLKFLSQRATSVTAQVTLTSGPSATRVVTLKGTVAADGSLLLTGKDQAGAEFRFTGSVAGGKATGKYTVNGGKTADWTAAP